MPSRETPSAFTVLRPLEVVGLAFVGFVCAKAGGVGAVLALTHAVVARALFLVAVLTLVSVVVLTRAALRQPFIAQPSLARWLGLLRPLALAPMAVGAVVVLWAAPSTQVESDASRVLVVVTALGQALALGSLPWVAWLAVRLDGALHPRFEAGRFARWALASLVDVARDWLPLVVLISGYSWMGAVMDLTPVRPADVALATLDRALGFGVDPIAALQPLISAPLSEFLAFSYSFYAPLFPLCFGAVLLRAGRGPFRETSFALGLGLLLAYISYTLVPAKGPLFTAQYQVPLDLYWVASIKAALMDLSRISYDCFPSMHTALTTVMLAQLHRHARRVFWVLLPLAGPIPFACVYLRYHYLVDVLAGLALAPALLWVARRLFRTTG